MSATPRSPSIPSRLALPLVVPLVLAVLGAAPATTGTGTAESEIHLVQLGLTGPSTDSHVTVGSLRSAARNGADHAASSELLGVAVDDLELGTWRTSSTDPADDPAPPLSLDAGDVTGSIDLADFSAGSSTDSAAATLALLQAEVSLLPFDLTAGLGERGSHQTVTATQATSVTDLVVHGLAIELGDLLPADVIDALPLQTLLDLVEATGLTLPADLTAAIDDLGVLLDELAAVETLSAELADVLDELAPLLEAERVAQEAVDDLVADIAILEAELATIQEQIALLDPVLDAALLLLLGDEAAAVQSELDDALQDLEEAELQLEQATLAADELAAELGIVELAEELTQAIADVAETADTLEPDGFADLRDELLDRLTGAPLLSLAELRLGTALLADLDGASSDTTCEAVDLRALGLHLPSPTCAEIVAVLEDVEALVAGVLGALPTTALPEPELEGLLVTGAGTGPDDDGTTHASAGIEALRIQLPPLDLVAVTDQLRADLIAASADAEAAVATLGLAGATSTLVPGIDTIGDDLDAVSAQLLALPDGTDLGGLRTLGLTASVGGIASEVSFTGDVVPDAPVTVDPAPSDEPTNAPAPPAAPFPPAPSPAAPSPAEPSPAQEFHPPAPEPGPAPSEAPNPAPSEPPVDPPAPEVPAPPSERPAPDLPQTGGGQGALALGLLGAAGLLGASTRRSERS